MSRHALVIGSTAQIGRATVATLLADGWAVTSVHRGSTPPPPQWREQGVLDELADREEHDALRDVVSRKGGADVLVDAIAYDDTHARQLLQVADDIGSVIVISSASVYADPAGRSLDDATGVDDFPRFDEAIREDDPTVPPGPNTYSTRKVLLERTLLDARRLPVTVVRPGAVHGQGSTSPREVWPLLRALDRRPRIPIAFRGESVFHTTSTPNLAELIRLAADDPGTRVLNAGDPQPPNVADIVRAVCATVGHGPELALFDGPPPASGAGRTPWSVPSPFRLDMRAAESGLPYRPVTTYADAVVDTCSWLGEQLAERPWRAAFPLLATLYGDLMDNYRAEDELLGELTR